MVLRCAFFHLSRVAEDGNYYRPQRYKDANALYAFKSRGFGGEVGIIGGNNLSCSAFHPA